MIEKTRSILAEDFSSSPYIPQVVFYQTGLGTSGDFSLDLKSGVTGYGMIDKIKESYAFIVYNWLPGDEILMIGALIDDVGILDSTEMDSFYDIFQAYVALGNNDSHKQLEANQFLSLYRTGGSKATRPMPKGTLKCIGVWDTVGALGIPLFTNRSSDPHCLGFVDTQLGKHVQYAFHALAIHETREDFLPTKWQQPPEQRQAGQILKQVWFPGSHSDVGGGYAEHDLADLALIWMVANLIEYGLLAIDTEFIFAIPAPKFGWGQMEPHNPREDFPASLSYSTIRKLPKRSKEVILTQERFHSSIISRNDLDEDLKKTLERSPDLITNLLPLEIEMKARWTRECGKQRSQFCEIREEVLDLSSNHHHHHSNQRHSILEEVEDSGQLGSKELDGKVINTTTTTVTSNSKFGFLRFAKLKLWRGQSLGSIFSFL
ncbi:uncharacterized protein MELLADRAFT_107125 [Melampsora larici-populina 98AG31]|uniref:T6SS Phospholipase effector Tle1-like catalytic domain-containing protein n=1 Tax=Melampsora larici-populina (strain 98AG31 / pathotype 3-4-7) TaxID=747676 RepID=F4RNR9_MELLP|nr:uncharacterized protein MELLADRAFT_107125 [Melampsora larici-populina 98AG31]EGG06034.1 hypothetical protein MELLADRAFT_107125 [Melampsora larici-populina 98AG31]